MNKIILGLVLGAVLGAFDGLTAWFTPEARSQLLGIVIGSTIKGLIAGILIGPGDGLFIPLGWWHQVNALEFSVTITHTNFRWPNDFNAAHPGPEASAAPR